MGPIKTHGPTVLAAIEQNDINKVTDILTNKFRDKQKTKQFLVSEVRRLQSESVGVPLLAAAALDDPSILRFLVNEHGADVNFAYDCGSEKNRKYEMAVLIAVKRSCYAMVDVIVSLGGDVNVQDQKRRTPLHHAVRMANRRMVRLLLFHGARSNICDADGQLPLDVAAVYGHQDLVRLLMNAGGNLYRPGGGAGAGSTPIHAAAREGHANLLQMFGELYRADGNFMTQCEDGISRTPLHVAAGEGNPDCVKALLEFCSADPNLKDSEGNGAIHCALANRCNAALGTPDEDDVVETVRVLVSLGADFNRGNGMGDTALHLAARNGFTKAVQVLVEAGCDVLMLDNSGLRAVDLLAQNDEFSKSIVMAAMEEQIRGRAEVAAELHPSAAKSKLHHPPGMRNHKSSSEIRNQDAQNTGTGVVRPRPAVRKTKSVENLDQELDNAPSQEKSMAPDPVTKALRIRSNSVQGPEVTDLKPSDVAQPAGKKLTGLKQKKPKKLIESEEPPETELLPTTVQTKKTLKATASVNETASMDRTTDSEEYLLNGDARANGKVIPPQVPKKTSKTKGSAETSKRKEDSQPSLQAWLDEQARLLKEKEKADQGGGPVAQSTPPTLRNNTLLTEHIEMSTNDSDSDANLLVEQRAKKKPPPPPKPTKVRNMSVSSAMNAETQKSDLPSLTKGRRVTSENTQIHAEVKNSLMQRRDSQTSLTGMAQIGIGENSLCFEPASPVIDVIPSKANSRLNMSLDSARANSSSRKNRPVPKARDLHSQTAQKSKLDPVMKVMTQDTVDASDPESISSSDEINTVTKAGPSIKLKRPMSTIKDSEVLPLASQRMHPAVTEQHSSVKPMGLVFERAAADVVPAKNLGKTRPQNGVDKDFNDRANDTVTSSVTSISKGSETRTKPSDVQKPSFQPKTTKKENEAVVIQQSESESEESEEESEDSEEEDDEEDESEDEDDEEEDETQPNQKVMNTSTAAKSLKDQEIRTVTFYGRDNPGFTIIGGNAEGIFVHSLDPSSEAARSGLSNGDQILRVNGKRVLGLTKEEASQILRFPGGELTLNIRSIPDRYKVVVDNGGIGDGLFVQAQFNHDAGKKGELNIREGDIFSVTDTLPENSPGIWKAHKINAKKNEEHIGTIPNRQRADQIAAKYRLSQGKHNPDQRGGTFFRSFRRSKSAERNSRGQEDEKNSSAVISDVISYQRVIQRLAENRRPVIVLGLFCDIVISMLIRDAPELFESPQEEVENSKSGEEPVNVRLIRASYHRNKHCLVILTPPSIEYLQQKTDLNPIVVYISPASKSVVKAVKAKLAPTYNKNAGYMFDEAAKFEKSYGHLFSTSVAYTTDDWWFFHLKEAIGRMQNQPIWRTITEEELETSAAAELNKICPGAAVLPPIQARQSRDKTPRFARTTDDLPAQANDGGVRGRPPLAASRGFDNKEVLSKSILKQRPPGESISSSDQVSIKSGIPKSMSVSFDEQEPSDMPKYISGKIPKPRNPANTASRETLL